MSASLRDLNIVAIYKGPFINDVMPEGGQRRGGGGGSGPHDQQNKLTCSAIWGLLDKDDDLRTSHELLNTERILNITQIDAEIMTS